MGGQAFIKLGSDGGIDSKNGTWHCVKCNAEVPEDVVTAPYFLKIEPHVCGVPVP